MSEETYNGWKNRETWAAALHLSNDEGLYLAIRHVVIGACYDADPAVPNEYAAARAIEAWVDENVIGPVLHPWGGDGEESHEWQRSMVADVGSFWRVDWVAVAESLMDEDDRRA